MGGRRGGVKEWVQGGSIGLWNLWSWQKKGKFYYVFYFSGFFFIYDLFTCDFFINGPLFRLCLFSHLRLCVSVCGYELDVSDLLASVTRNWNMKRGNVRLWEYVQVLIMCLRANTHTRLFLSTPPRTRPPSLISPCLFLPISLSIERTV